MTNNWHGPTGGTFTLNIGTRFTPPIAWNAPNAVVWAERQKLLKLAEADQHEIQAERCEREAMRLRNRLTGRSLGLLREASAHRDKAGRCWAEAQA